jgi:glyoxylase-like metal-dependent hydrolase (beta-lactamase superfamily II)
VIAHVEATGLRVEWLLETHAHADHLSAAPICSPAWGKIAIGSHIREVQAVFSRVFNLPDMDNGGREFDHLFEDGEHFAIGTLDVRVIHTPATHQPA